MEDRISLDPTDRIDIEDLKDVMNGAILRLPPRERLVIALYYYEELTLKEIGSILNVSESRISQIHTKAIVRLRARVDADDRDAALRGVVLRISFDGSQRPQVEAPVGDFFGSGPGVNPFSSSPMTVRPDGTMECRFVMPYARSCRIAFRNLSPVAARVVCERTVE